MALFAGSPLSWNEQRALAQIALATKALPSPATFSPTGWSRMMERLRLTGFAARLVDGSYAITDAGRNHLHHLVIEAEARSGTALGNYNEAKERGNSKRAEQQLAASQEWLDVANELRGWGAGESRIRL